MKKTIITAILAAMTLLLIGCSANNERIDLTDPLSGSSILSAADLEAFFKYGENDTAVLAASFSMEDTMLKQFDRLEALEASDKKKEKQTG